MTNQSLNAVHVPVDMWRLIVKALPYEWNHQSLISLACTCKFLKQLTYETSAIKNFHKAKQLNHAREMVKGEVEKETRILGEIPNQTSLPQQLSTSPEGYLLFSYPHSKDPHILWLQCLDEKTGSFSLQSIDLIEALQSAASPYLLTNDAQRIIACHFREGELLVVVASGVFLWKYQRGQLSEPKFFAAYEKNVEFGFCKFGITSSALQKEFLFTKAENPFFRIFSLKDQKWTVSRHGDGRIFKFLNCETKGHLLIQTYVKEKGTYISKLVTDQSRISPTNDHVLVSQENVNCEGFGDLVVVKGSTIDLREAHNDLLWLANDKESKGHRPEKVTILGDFLIISYQYTIIEELGTYVPIPNFKIFFIPTKTNFTDKLRPLLDPFLKQGKKLFSIAVSEDESRECVLTVVFIEERDKKHVFQEVKFFLSKEVVKLPEPDKEIEGINNTPSYPIWHKVSLVAGVALFLLTCTTLVLLSYYRIGRILYQGHGIALTAPELIVGMAGGIPALVLMAVGSYKWWKSKKRL